MLMAAMIMTMRPRGRASGDGDDNDDGESDGEIVFSTTIRPAADAQSYQYAPRITNRISQPARCAALRNQLGNVTDSRVALSAERRANIARLLSGHLQYHRASRSISPRAARELQSQPF